MAKAIETLKIAIDFQDKGSQAVIEKLKNSLQQLERGASGAKPRIASLRKEILAQGNASVKSIANINAQSTALKALRDEAKIGGRAFNQLTKDIAKLDAQMGKSGKTTQGRGGARQATQIAGAVISGGIFGGPEGALGAVGGAALGGVEGAFAGAAIGAQLKAIRELTAGAADYAAQIEKLEIALEGVSGGADNYNSALETARQVTADFNVPALDSVRGVTRLTAAVRGAGGPIGDAETTFRNVTAAIKATGGSTEDVRGAITAMVQVFSKGKVSAEELSGQLGERLPGAVTLFAKANDMTLPELQKNLKAGTVGLNELMNFIVELGDTYAGTASKIADSNAEAGARLAVAVQDMQAQVGAALIPIGAQFQDAFAAFIKEITPFLVTNVPKIANLFLALAKNLDTLVVAATAAFAVFAVAKITAIVTSLGGIKTALFLIKQQMVAIALANPFTALAVGAGILAGAIFNASKEQKRFNDLLREGSVAQVSAELQKLEKDRDQALGKLVAAKAKAGDGYSDIGGYEAEQQEVDRLTSKIEQLRKKKNQITDTDPTQGAALERYSFSQFEPFDYGSPAAGDSGGTQDTLARRVKQAQDLESRMQRQLVLAQSQGEIGRVLAQQANQRSQLEQKIAALKKDGTSEELNRAAASAQTALNDAQRLEMQKRINKLYDSALGPLNKAIEAVKEKAKSDKRYKDLLAKGIKPERAKDIINLEKLKKKALDRLDVEINILKAIVNQGGATQAQIDTLDEFIRKRKEAEGIDPEKETEGGSYKEDKNDFEEFKESFTAGLEDMMDVGPKLANTALGAIGSMTDGLIEMITTGKANFKEMAASILKDIAKIMIQAAIAGAVKKMFGLADGGVIQGGRLKPYAKGGVVAAPTFFPMAGGDVGLMGEAGPEAVMPLKRASNGKLGVEVAGRSNAIDAMNRYSMRNNAGGTTGFGPTGDQAAEGLEAAPQPIDVRYNVERINSVDYVTADQFQAGMRQAATQGAKQGEQQTLRRLQMSGSTRKRVGM